MSKIRINNLIQAFIYKQNKGLIKDIVHTAKKLCLKSQGLEYPLILQISSNDFNLLAFFIFKESLTMASDQYCT